MNARLKIPWRFKAMVFKCIDLLKAGRFLTFIQKYLTRSAKKDLVSKLHIWEKHKAILEEYGVRSVFEFGAGRHLAQNIYFSNYFESQVVVDIEELIDLELVEESRVQILDFCHLRIDGALTTLEDLLQLGIRYYAPVDLLNTGFPDNYFDSCVTTDTVEHIPIDQLLGVLQEVKRIVKPLGMISFSIDYSDHYAHTDPNISPLNFLKFEESEWNRFNFICHFQNRLRHFEYLEIFSTLGFEVVFEEVEWPDTDVSSAISDRYIGKPETWRATRGFVVAQNCP